MKVLTTLLILLATLAAPAYGTAQEPDSAIPLPRIGRARISAVYDLIVAPPYAYALERENLYVLDVRDPRAVREVANLEFMGPRLWGVVYGSGVYLGGFRRPLAVVDVSDPLRPIWFGDDPDITEPLAALLVNDRLYVVEPGPPLTLTVMRPSQTAGFPERLVGLAIETARGQRFSGVDHDGGRLYLLLERPRSAGSELAVINVNEPERPVLERRIMLPQLHDYRKIAVRGDLAYATIANADAEFGLATFRLGDAEATMLGSITDPRLWNGGRMIVNGQAIYATYKHEAILATFDVSDPHSPRLAHTVMTRAGTSGLGFSRAGDRLYVSGDAGPSTIFDISEPLAPHFLGSWNYAGGWARSVTVQGNTAVVLNWGIGFLVYDIEDPASPTLLGSYMSVNGDPGHLALNGDLVLLSQDSLPTEVVDISNPSSPQLVARYGVPGAVAAGVLDFPRAVQAYRAGAVGIIDVTAPDTLLGYLELEHAATDLKVHGDLAVIAHPDGGISAIDITNAESPVFEGRAPGSRSTDNDPDDMTTRLILSPDGASAYTVNGETESEDGSVTISRFDIRVASRIRRIATLEVPFAGYAQDYTILGGEGELFVAMGSDIVRIDLREPTRLRIGNRYRTSASIEGLAKQGQLLVVAASEDGMQLFVLRSRRP